ncbi:response regulator [Spongorhabdus nitratireducens]
MSADKIQESKFWPGRLATSLFFWFMLLSMVPVGIIGFVEYDKGKSVIVENKYHELSTVNQLLSRRLNEYFESIVTNLYVRAELAEKFVGQLSEGLEASRQTLPEYVRSDGYYALTDKYSNDLLSFLRFYDYSDVLIGDREGNLLYTVNGYEDLGQNLFSGDLRDTKLTSAVIKSFRSRLPQFSDVGRYEPVGDDKVCFFVLPLVNREQEVSGFLAVQLYAGVVQEFFNQGMSLGDGTTSYLVGKDKRVRFGEGLNTTEVMSRSSDTELIQFWLNHLEDETGEYTEHDHGSSIEFALEESADDHGHDDSEHSEDKAEHEDHMRQMMAHIKNYQNAQGEKVLGVFSPISIAGTSMALVSEVTEKWAFASIAEFRTRLLLVSLITSVMVLLAAAMITRRMVKPIRMITGWVQRVAAGEFVQGRVLSQRNEIGDLSRSFSVMTEQLRQASEEGNHRSWVQDGQAGLNDCIRGEHDLTKLATAIISYMARYLEIPLAAIYILNEEEQALKLMGAYAWQRRKHSNNAFKLGEGLVGQAALENQAIEVDSLPEGYFSIRSGMGEMAPHMVLVTPFSHNGKVKGVIEFALVHELSELKTEFIAQSLDKVASSVHSAQARGKMNVLLEQTTRQSEAMKQQQEELKSVNEELENRAQVLEESEEEMRAQSEELQKSNAELEEKTEQLQQQKYEIEQKNIAIQAASDEVNRKAKELAQASKYKSEFLANMSHELRTPLNSLLLLSQMLANNDDGNLNEDQIESAQVIYNGGKDLLDLINDILDLSKVEAGKMTVTLEDVELKEIAKTLQLQFAPLAKDKGLDYVVTLDENAPQFIMSDSQRLLQIIKNFLSNAFKFTAEGQVSIDIKPVSFSERAGEGVKTMLAFGVTDQGIGIPKEKQDAIFEAFQQADGSTSRQYGGTGLGLAISKEMAGLLGGHIGIESEEGKGSTFSLYLPIDLACSLGGNSVEADYKPGTETSALESSASEGVTVSTDEVDIAEISDKARELDIPDVFLNPEQPKEESQPAAVATTPDIPDVFLNAAQPVEQSEPAEKAIEPEEKVSTEPEQQPESAADTIQNMNMLQDDRKSISRDDRVLLVVEDDRRFGDILAKSSRKQGYKFLYAETGKAGLMLAKHYRPDAIVLDLGLPDMDGQDVLQELKEDESTATIPVHIVSGRDPDGFNNSGTLSYLVKPVSNEQLNKLFLTLQHIKDGEIRKVLLVDGDDGSGKVMAKLLGQKKAKVCHVKTMKAALKTFSTKNWQCLIVDVDLPDGSGLDLLKQLEKVEGKDLPPVIVHAGRTLGEEEHRALQKYTHSMIMKGEHSDERMNDEVSLFMHSVQKSDNKPVPEVKAKPPAGNGGEKTLKGKKILLVDDDLRNTFALSKALQAQGLDITIADNGQMALDKLAETEGIDLVLMDIMMPVMDGYEATQKIRENKAWKDLPVIALTAKAMADDRAKCIDAGANDYLTKPVDMSKLTEMMKLWLYR